MLPSWWRERYADEVRVVSNDMTAEGRSTLMVTLNLLGGAVRARSSAQGMPKTYGLWSARAKISIAAATLPWLVVAPLAAIAIGNQTLHSSAGLVTWSGFNFLPTHLQTGFSKGTPVAAPPLTSGGQAVLYAMFAFVMLFLATFVVLISGWSGLTGAIKRSGAPHRRRLLLLAWAPVFSLLIDVALMIAQNTVQYPARYVPKFRGKEWSCCCAPYGSLRWPCVRRPRFRRDRADGGRHRMASLRCVRCCGSQPSPRCAIRSPVWQVGVHHCGGALCPPGSGIRDNGSRSHHAGTPSRTWKLHDYLVHPPGPLASNDSRARCRWSPVVSLCSRGKEVVEGYLGRLRLGAGPTIRGRWA